MTTSSSTAVLFASSRGDAGAGGETYLLQVMRHLDRARFRPIVVLPHEGSLRPALEELDVEVTVVEANYTWLGPDPAWYKFLEGADRRVQTLSQIIRKHQVKLVHTNSNFRLDAAFAGLLCGVPHLYLAHAEYQPELSIFVRLGLSPEAYAQLMGRISTRILAVSRSVADLLSPPVDPAKIRVVHNGVEIDRFDHALAARPRRLHQELNLPEDAMIVTGVGRLVPEKGFDFFLQAAARIAEDFPEAHFVIAGGSGENPGFEAHLRELATAPQLAGRTHFIGFRKDIVEILAETDIFVLSSRREGHPYVLLEAMAARCAPVAVRCLGVDETLTPEVDGLIVPMGDVEAMAQAVTRLLRKPDLREALARHARETIQERFQARDSVTALMAEYDRILSQPAPLPGDPGVALFLRACHEFGVLGRRLIDAEQRLNDLEGFVGHFRDNALMRGLRHLRNRKKARP